LTQAILRKALFGYILTATQRERLSKNKIETTL